MIPGLPPEPAPGTPGGPGYIPPGVPGSPEYIPGMPGTPEYQPLRRMNRRYPDAAYGGERSRWAYAGLAVFALLFLAALSWIVLVGVNVLGSR
jgi:hypothetical protein